jgi:hybrid cluster-associated redox disulfide protein
MATKKTDKKPEKKIKKLPKKSAKKITGKTKLSDIMKINPKAGMVLFESGMHCLGCGMAVQENLEDGCLAHGMNKKEINELIKKLNKKQEQF